MRTRSVAAGIVLLSAVALGGSAPQVRDGVPGQSKGSGVITGTVVAGDTGLPVRGARVALTGSNLQQSIGRLSDDQGAFVFEGLEAGQYRLWAARLGYVAASYGEKRPGSGVAGRPIVLADKQRVDKLELSLPRAAALEGIVSDEFGPATSATVQALRIVYRAGKKGLISSGVAPVNDRGEYRLFSLPPGEYIVQAVSSPGGLSLTESFQSGFSSGRVKAGNAPSILTELGPWARESTSPTEAGGFHPAGFSVESATVIELDAGGERRGVDIRAAKQRVFTVSGVIQGSRGLVSGAAIGLVPKRTPIQQFSDGIAVAGMTKSANGSFQMNRVPAGLYVLIVFPPNASSSTSSEPAELFQQDLTVAGDTSNLHVALMPAGTLAGTVTADDGSRLEWPKVISFVPVETYFVTGPQKEHYARVEEGRFTVAGVFPGRFRLSLHNEPDWTIASATSAGRDVMDTYLDVAPGDTLALQVVLTKRTTELSGTLVGLSADSNYTVVAFSPDERHWVPEGRRLATVEPTTAGRYTFKGLPPGAYRLALMEDFDAAAGLYPDLLKQLAASSTLTVILTDGEKKAQDLRVR